MADQKVSQLSEIAEVQLTDRLYIVDDPGGTPGSFYVQVGNLAASNPGAASKLLKTDASGHLFLQALWVSAIAGLTGPADLSLSPGGNLNATPSGNVVLNPTGVVQVQGHTDFLSAARIGTNNFSAQTTGWRITYAGAADFRSAFVDSLTVKGNVTVDTDTFFVDATNNRLGVRTTSPRLGSVFVISGSTGSGVSATNAAGAIRVGFSSGYGIGIDSWDSGQPRWGIINFSTDTPTVMIEGIHNSTDVWFLAGRVAVGVSPASYKFDLLEDRADYMARFFNDGNASTRNGIIIQAGQDTNPNHTAILLRDGDGTVIGSVAGNGSGGVNYNQTSDLRTKADIEPIRGALDSLLKIKPIKYRGKGQDNIRPKTPGMVAQDVQQVYPELVTLVENEYLQLNYTGFIPYTIAALQELAEKIRKLEAQWR